MPRSSGIGRGASIPFVGLLGYHGLYADVAQLVERDLAKVEVAGSSPVVRSKYFRASFKFDRELCRALLVTELVPGAVDLSR